MTLHPRRESPWWPLTFLGCLLPASRCYSMICLLSFAAAYRNLGQNLWGPHRYGCLAGVRVRTVVSGSCAAHSLLITTEGKLWSWGKSGLGWGRATQERDPPTPPARASSPFVCPPGRVAFFAAVFPLPDFWLVPPVPYKRIPFLHCSVVHLYAAT